MTAAPSLERTSAQTFDLTEPGAMRQHDFTDAVVREIGQSAMYVCQNPGCLCFTGFTTSDGRPRRIAEAAHVLPAGGKGPRASDTARFPDVSRGTAENGLWLCRNCHSEIDGDTSRFPPEELFRWKSEHADLMRRIVGRDLEAALLRLGNAKRYHQEVRDLLSFFESRRLLYEGLDAEFPPRVLDSIEMIRMRLVQVRASINPDVDLYEMIASLQAAVDRFMRNIGARTDLRSLRCDSRDPKWRKFASSLKDFRTEAIVLLRVLAGSADYQLSKI